MKNKEYYKILKLSNLGNFQVRVILSVLNKLGKNKIVFYIIYIKNLLIRAVFEFDISTVNQKIVRSETLLNFIFQINLS